MREQIGHLLRAGGEGEEEEEDEVEEVVEKPKKSSSKKSKSKSRSDDDDDVTYMSADTKDNGEPEAIVDELKKKPKKKLPLTIVARTWKSDSM